MNPIYTVLAEHGVGETLVQIRCWLQDWVDDPINPPPKPDRQAAEELLQRLKACEEFADLVDTSVDREVTKRSRYTVQEVRCKECGRKSIDCLCPSNLSNSRRTP